MEAGDAKFLKYVDHVAVVDIVWEGPFSPEEVKRSRHDPADYGIYQVYGTHGSGADQLLYIGAASDQKFGIRVSQHAEWTEWEAKEVEVYLGRIGHTTPIATTLYAQREWGKWIRWVESVLIYFVAPPYNSCKIRTARELAGPSIVILNFKRRHRLPAVISNLYEKSPVGDRNSSWRPFEEPDVLNDDEQSV